jgi:Kdo2-lipid IVA lauroyltransferase/acyltransferase
MAAVLYYIFILPLIYLVSIMPFWILYGISDVLFVFTYYIFGYRKKVVMMNLQNAFPDKSPTELKKLERTFFRYLCDTIIETIKLITISPKQLVKRAKLDDELITLFANYKAENKSTIAVLGHCGNWEWASNSFSIVVEQPMHGVYHQLSNKQFDTLIYNMRSRFGNVLIEMKNVVREMIKNKDVVCVNGFIADQTPAPEGAYWTKFLNQHTPVFNGTEKIARKLNQPVVFISVIKIKRGYYKLSAEVLCENPKDTKDGEITEWHTRKLEKDILAQPANWLWSHKRWKHSGKYEALKAKGLVN